MLIHDNLSLVNAKNVDRIRLVGFLDSCHIVHRHLDWHTPMKWREDHTFWVGEYNHEIVAAITCPIYPPEVAWIRLFASNNSVSLKDSWQILWRIAKETLTTLHRQGQQVQTIAAIPLQGWFENLLNESGFKRINQIVLLENDFLRMKPHGFYRTQQRTGKLNGKIRQITKRDLREVLELDTQAFIPLWRYTYEEFELAFSNGFFMTVYQDENDKILAYQITTISPKGSHLARLAVLPSVQGLGIGTDLVTNLLLELKERKINRLTVNTQVDNAASLAVYLKTGFRYTSETYPVYSIERPFT